VYSHRPSSGGTTAATVSGASATAEVRVGTLPLEVRLVSGSLWRVSDAVLFDAAVDAAALTMSRLLTSPTGVESASEFRGEVDAVAGFDRAALEALISRPSHDLSEAHDRE
jgi:hypothetical protein